MNESIDFPTLVDRYKVDGKKVVVYSIGKNAWLDMGQGNIRNQLYKRLKDIGYTIPDIIDTTAVAFEDVADYSMVCNDKTAKIPEGMGITNSDLYKYLLMHISWRWGKCA